MPEFCNCGAQLPPDAVFCHKCGKPQRDIVEVEPEIAPPPQVPRIESAPVAEVAAVNFRNMEALKIAGIAAVLATFLFFIPYVNWVAAGYFAVFFYRRRTRQSVNSLAGVRIGWLTGLMAYALLAILILSSVLMLRVPGMMAVFKVAAEKDNSVQQWLTMIQNGPQLAGLLAALFVFVTFLSMTGGLLGAVLTGRVTQPPRGGNIV
jgi:hypothetical protein